MTVPTTPFAFKTASVSLDIDGSKTDFSSHIDEIRLEPSVTSHTWKAVDGYTIGDADPADWSVVLGLVQDLDDNGLLRYLLKNEGKTATLTATLAEGTDTITTKVTLVPAGIGGTSTGGINRSSVTLPATGGLTWGTI